MDPITQATAGAIAAQLTSKKVNLRLATFCGVLAGMAADLDILIKSANDPLLAVEMHRHFTHAIFFIPFGGLLVAFLIWLLLLRKHNFKELAIYSIAAYATHGCVDALTSYGTMLYWPFYSQRIAWDVMPIIEPFFTIPLLIMVMLACILKAKNFSKAAIIYTSLFLTIAFIQKQRIDNYVVELAASRGHTIEKQKFNPTIGNILLWRSVYQAADKYYVDAIRAGRNIKLYEGTEVAYLDPNDVISQLATRRYITKDIERFTNFSQGFIYYHPNNKNIIADLRYGTLPNDNYSLWGIKLKPEAPNEHVDYVFMRDFTSTKIDIFKNMLYGKELD